MHEIRMNIEKHDSDSWIDLCINRHEISNLLIRLIEMKLGRYSQLVIKDPENGDTIKLVTDGSDAEIILSDESYYIDKTAAELIVSFLVDQTDPLCFYDHIDLTLANEKNTIDVAFSVCQD